MGLFSRKTNNVSTANTEYQTFNTDNRVTAGAGAVVLGNAADYFSDSSIRVSDNSATYNDYSLRTSVTDYSNRSLTDNRQSFTDFSDRSINDYSDRSTYTSDSRDQSSNWFDNSDRSTYFSDSRDLSTYLLDNSDRSTSESYTDSRDFSRFFVDDSDRSTEFDFADYSDRSSRFQLTDSRDLSSYFQDRSDRSVTNITGIDPGAVRVAEFGADLVRGLGAEQTEGMRLVAGFGADAMRYMGESATNLYQQAGANYRNLLQTSQTQADQAAQTWEATVAASRDLLGGILERAGSTVDAAGRLAEVAVMQAQPVEGKNADTMRKGLMIAAGLGALLILPRLLKG